MAIAICAGIARRWSLLRAAMWATSLIIVTINPSHGIVDTALQRSGGVLLGGLIGAAIHLALDRIIPAVQAE